MADAILVLRDEIRCAHGGHVLPTAASSRVKVAGFPVLLQGAAMIVVQCPSLEPCRTVYFSQSASRVRTVGRPPLLRGSFGECAPLGEPAIVESSQNTVRAL